jgi:hypothetical protein
MAGWYRALMPHSMPQCGQTLAYAAGNPGKSAGAPVFATDTDVGIVFSLIARSRIFPQKRLKQAGGDEF